MIIATSIDQVRRWRHADRGSVGLVPTMGFLHAGHLSLVRRARAESDRVAASIFVNPTQFGPTEDLARYPRDLERDKRLLADAGCDLVFVPDQDTIYPRGFQTFVEPGDVAAPLEGAQRPGHFRGVTTVVLKLLHIFEPTRAYFGEKDAQQLAVIRRMVRDLDVPVEVVGCPTVREPDGLALSSRNTYLGPEDRQAATVLHRALDAARALWQQGERRGEALRQAMRAVLASEPRAQVDYVSAADPHSLTEIDRAADAVLLSMAVVVGPARLIDNVLLDAPDPQK